MTPQERQMIDDLFDRLARLESAPRDPDAGTAIMQGLRRAPNAVYALVQTVLVQDEALKRANTRIQELEAAGAAAPQQSGGFLDSVRETFFGQSPSRGSVPNVRPPEVANRPVWNSGQAAPGGYNQGYMQGGVNQGGYNQAGYAPPYGAPQSPFGGGGSFLGTAAAAAAGMIGGSMLLGGIRSMMGGSHYGFGDPTTVVVENAAAPGPWSDASGSDLARDAGINDIGASGDRSPAGFLDSASNDYSDDRDAMDLDSDNFGGGNDDSDFA
jgi:hypothetical protein